MLSPDSNDPKYWMPSTKASLWSFAPTDLYKISLLVYTRKWHQTTTPQCGYIHLLYIYIYISYMYIYNPNLPFTMLQNGYSFTLVASPNPPIHHGKLRLKALCWAGKPGGAGRNWHLSPIVDGQGQNWKRPKKTLEIMDIWCWNMQRLIYIWHSPSIGAGFGRKSSVSLLTGQNFYQSYSEQASSSREIIQCTKLVILSKLDFIATEIFVEGLNQPTNQPTNPSSANQATPWPTNASASKLDISTVSPITTWISVKRKSEGQ